jgi:hypothetical protein
MALLVNSTWLGGQKGSYEFLKACPPTIVAYFMERILLCEGEVKLKGSTAASYIWLVWRQPVYSFDDTTTLFIPPEAPKRHARREDADKYTRPLPLLQEKAA